MILISTTHSHYHALSIAQAIAKIEANELVLPLIQRNFVWDIERVTKLFDSILQGYPINSMLFWQVPEAAMESVQMYAFIRHFSHYCWFGEEQMETENHERYYNQALPRGKAAFPTDLLAVLDGQQRLTSLYLGLCGSYAEKLYWRRGGRKYPENYPPRALYLCVTDPAPAADTLDGYRSNRYQLEWREVWWEEGKLVCPQVVANEANTELWMHLGEVMLGAEVSAETWATSQLGVLHEFAAGLDKADIPSADFEHAYNTLKRLHEAVHLELYISYYREEGKDLARAVETFIRINNGGMVIGYADLLFSILSAQWTQRNAREEIEKVETMLRGYRTGLNLEKGFILKAALIMAEGHNLRFELSQFTSQRVQTMERIWPIVTRALEQAAQAVEASGVLFLSAPSLITVLAYFFYRRAEKVVQDADEKDNARIKQWLIRTQLLWSTERTTTETKISQLVQLINAHFETGEVDFPFAALVEKSWGVDMRLASDANSAGLYLDALLNQSKGEGTTRFLLGLLHTNALPYVSYDIDHCFPYHEAYNADNYDAQHDAEINALPNLQLLPSSLNKSKSGRRFQSWYDELPKLLEAVDVQQDLNVTTQAQLHAAHFYPTAWLPYDEEDDEATRLAKFRVFFHGRRATTLERLKAVFYDPA